MADLLSAMVQASKRVADPRAAAYASGNRPYLVRIERPGAQPTFDRDTGLFVNPADTVLYTGPGRIRPADAGAELEIGGESLSFTAAVISIDMYAGTPPRAEDLLYVEDTPLAQSTHLVGRVFAVTSVEVGGHFGIGYVLRALGVAPSRRV